MIPPSGRRVDFTNKPGTKGGFLNTYPSCQVLRMKVLSGNEEERAAAKELAPFSSGPRLGIRSCPFTGTCMAGLWCNAR